MNIDRYRSGLCHIAVCLAAVGLWQPSVQAQVLSLPDSGDTQTLRLGGARIQGALLTPSARLLEKHAWDLSLTYNFDDAVLRTTVLTGEVRGGNTREKIRWLDKRHSLYAQFAIAPTDRVELVVGMPVLIDQSSQAGIIVDAAPTGSAALGDMRLLARVGLLHEDHSPLSWNLDLGMSAPSGNQDFLYGEGRVRYLVGTTLGVQLPAGFRIDGRLAHENAAMSVVGNQMLGDTLIVQAAVSQTILSNLRWFAELSNVNVISSNPAGVKPKRNGLELAAGIRYRFENFYLDGGVGFGALDAGYTPGVRAQLSIGTTGRIGSKASESSRSATEQVNSVTFSPEAMEQLRELLNDSSSQRTARSAQCLLPPEDYSGAITADGCIDFSQPNTTEGFQRLSLEETKVYFELNKSRLTDTSADTVRKVALILMHNEGNIRVIGNADDQGESDRNEHLSRERAEVVMNALIDAGIAKERLQIDSRGSESPISPTTDFGRSVNRRVDFEWE